MPFVIWLHKVGLQLFRLKFVVFSFNVASEVTEMGKIIVVWPKYLGMVALNSENYRKLLETTENNQLVFSSF